MKMDEKTAAQVEFASQGVFRVQDGEIINAKISRNKRAKEQVDKKEARQGKVKGCKMSETEAIAEILGYKE